MAVLVLCAVTWLALLGSSATLWAVLERPWAPSDLVVLVLVTAAAAAFTRLGLVSLLGLALRILPDGRLRARATALALRCAPRLLGSTVLAAVAVTGTVEAAGADEVPSAEAVASSASDRAPDPGWPSVPADPKDPGWPTTGPNDDDRSEATDRPDDDRPDESDSPDGSASRPSEPPPRSELPPPSEPADPPRDPAEDADPPRTHVVAAGESLWSIAGDLTDSGISQAELVETIYADNRDAIGPDPDLIMPGQRLEIRS